MTRQVVTSLPFTSVPATQVAIVPALPFVEPGQPGQPGQPGRKRGDRKGYGRRAMGHALRDLVAGAPGIHGVSAQGPRSTASYQGGAWTQQNRDWLTRHYSGDAAIHASWTSVTQRCRDLVRNEPWAMQAMQRIVQNVVGESGIQAEAEVEFDDDAPDDEANRAIDEGFLRWCDEADAEGRSHWAEMQALGCGETAETGDTFLCRVALPDRNRFLPLAYTILEAEQINDMLDRPLVKNGENRIKRGVELDRWNRAVAYHFWTEHPYDMQISATDTMRVPAERIIHHYARRRPSQVRGISWFAPILQALRDLNKYMEAETTAAWLAALFTVAIKRAAGAGGGLGFRDGDDPGYDDDGNPLDALGPGVIADLGPSDEVEQIQANRPNPQAAPWIELMLSSMANGVGMTYLGLTGDASKSSFSAGRGAHLKDKVFWRTLQGRFGRSFVLPVRRQVVAQMVAYGRIPSISPTQFLANPHHWLQTRLLPPGWEDIQDLDGVKAAIERIKAGLSTLQDECAGRGKNWRRNLKQRAREESLREELELRLTTDSESIANPSGPAGGSPGNQASGNQASGSEDPGSQGAPAQSTEAAP